MPVANGVEKAFPGAGTKPGIEVWRIEVKLSFGLKIFSFRTKFIILYHSYLRQSCMS